MRTRSRVRCSCDDSRISNTATYSAVVHIPEIAHNSLPLRSMCLRQVQCRKNPPQRLLELLDMKPSAVPGAKADRAKGGSYRPRSPRSKVVPNPPKLKRSMTVQAGMEAPRGAY